MLYPDFDDLVSYKDIKWDVAQASRRPSHAIALGGQHSPFRGQGLEFDSVRKYVPGDDIRNIDWKVTARIGSPHLKVFQEERQRHLVLCIDKGASMQFGTRRTFKSVQAARIAALLGWQGLAHQDRISACLFGDVPGGIEFFSPKQSHASFSLLLRKLSQPGGESHSVSFKDVLQSMCQAAHTGSLVYFISDFMEIGKDQEQEALLSRFAKKCDVVLVAVNDPADKALDSVGRLALRGRGNEKIVVNTDSVAGRNAYSLQWKENRAQLYDMASRFRIPLIELTTESEIKKEFVLALKSLAQRRRR